MKRTLNGLFPVLFLSPGEGGGIGDVADIPHGEEGDLKILAEGNDDDGEDTGVAEDDTSDSDDDGADGGPEVFEDPDEEPGKEDKPASKKEGEETEGEGDKFEGRPTLTDIKTKYPKIFKEFPELREVLFREQEFTKAFGTVEEAADASAKATSFDVLEAALLAGDSSPIIAQLAKTAPESLGKVVENFLPTLLKQSQDLYLKATVPVIEQLLFMAHKHGVAANDPNLMRSAQHIANFMFGKPEIPDPGRRADAATRANPAEAQLNKEREEWNRTRFQEASQEVAASIDVDLESDILRGLDPDRKLSGRQRVRLLQDIKDEIDATLQKDPAFMRQMKSLWQRAATASYPKDQRASIKSAFLARAKALVPSVRSRLRAEWFGEQGPSGDGKLAPKDKQQQPLKKRTLPASGPSSGASGPKRPPSPKDIDYSKTSDLDLIEGRFHRKS